MTVIGFSISKLFFHKGNREDEVNKLRKASLALQKEKKEILVKNGYDEDALTTKFFCPVCSDTGYYNDRMCNCHKELLKEIERDSLRKNSLSVLPKFSFCKSERIFWLVP